MSSSAAEEVFCATDVIFDSMLSVWWWWLGGVGGRIEEEKRGNTLKSKSKCPHVF